MPFLFFLVEQILLHFQHCLGFWWLPLFLSSSAFGGSTASKEAKTNMVEFAKSYPLWTVVWEKPADFSWQRKTKSKNPSLRRAKCSSLVFLEQGFWGLLYSRYLSQLGSFSFPTNPLIFVLAVLFWSWLSTLFWIFQQLFLYCLYFIIFSVLAMCTYAGLMYVLSSTSSILVSLIIGIWSFGAKGVST